ncbi:MAG: cell wall-binding repeat-containing protein, partial [Firmicutes bacterium]|nr:cell wall-binding repeat-containing protein [Bacillota bacterium]
AEEFREQLGTDKLSSVIIACGTNYADALSGSYLSSVRKAPILLTDTKKDHIDLVRNYINDHVKKGGTVYLLGGPAVVPDSVKTGLGDFVVTRLWGADRYETNMAVLKEAGIASEDILVCSGMNFPDSLSAAAAGSPIILVKNEIQSFQKEYLQDLTGKKIYIIGGEGAVNEKIFSSFEAFGTVERIGGTDRYETSALFADKFFDNCEGAVLAYGRDFPDGLCGGALANIKGVPLLLTAEGKIDAARSFIAKKAGQFIDDGGKIKADILGGPALISDENALISFGIENVGKVVVK